MSKINGILARRRGDAVKELMFEKGFRGMASVTKTE
jgi:hypothetical protein